MALLTDTAIKNWKPTKERETKPCGGRDSLYVRATLSGSKTFYWRKGSFYKLGDYPTLSLSRARVMATLCNERVREGLAPEQVIAAMRGAPTVSEVANLTPEEINSAPKSRVRSKAPKTAGNPTFDSVFHEFYAVYAESNLQAGPSRKQPLSLYRDHVPAAFKSKPVREIQRADIFPWMLRLLQTKHETGRRLRSQLERIFEYAINCGYVDLNPTPSRRAFEIKKPKPKPHGTLDYTRLPELWRWLDDRQFMPQTKMAIRLLILSAHRVGVVLAAKWEHFDLQAGTWTIPERTDNVTPGLMKSGRAHTTTLPKPFLAELEQLRSNSPYLFQSDSAAGYITENAVLKALQEFDSGITAHGFRNTFKTWARSEGVPDWIADAYVDHSLKGLDRSYRREDVARVLAECAKVTEKLFSYVADKAS